MRKRLRPFAAALLCAAACAPPATANAAAEGGPFIIGGSSAPAGAWPSIAYLRGAYHSTDGELREFACTGSVVAPQWIVTAAHCTLGESGEPVEQMVATLGVTDYTDPAAERVTVDRLVADPAYDPGRLVADVGLLHLAQPTTSPAIPLATGDAGRYSSPPGMPNAAGWGAIDEDGSQFTTELQQAYLALDSPDECGRLISGFDPATQTCAGTEGTAGACFGDSGGPLVEVDAQTRRPALVGVTSYGPQSAAGLAACSTRLPAVYASVVAAADFIGSTIAATSAAPGAAPPAATPAPTPPAAPATPPAADRSACRRARAAVRSARAAERRALRRLRSTRRHRHGAAARRQTRRARHAYHVARARHHRTSATAARRCR